MNIFIAQMSQSDFETLKKTGKVSAAGETFISQSKEYSQKYDGVLVKFQVASGTLEKLKKIGVRQPNEATAKAVPGMPVIKRGWAKENAQFKIEGEHLNIGLGDGKALDTFNSSIRKFEALEVTKDERKLE